MNARNRHTRCGFTLVELLVAMAIFLVVMGSVALLFTQATRVTRQGFQNQEAFEKARGALDIMERDLTRAFTSRDHGDIYNFYGTPIGFTFVGLVPIDDSGEVNIARVTYAVRLTERDVPLSTIDDEVRQVHSLIRYIEPEREDLDSFPILWSSTFANDAGITLEQVINQEIVNGVNSGRCDVLDDAQCEVELRKIARRELWIRMLAGDPSLPDFFGDIRPDLDVIDFVVTENIIPVVRTVEIDEETGKPVQRLEYTANPPRIRVNDSASISDVNDYFFSYTDFNVGRDETELVDQVFSVELAYWNDGRNIDLQNDLFEEFGPQEFDDLDNPELDYDRFSIGSPFVARLPQQINVQFVLFFESPYPGAPDYNRAFSEKIDLHTGFRRLPIEFRPGGV